jgi:ribonuclease HI
MKGRDPGSGKGVVLNLHIDGASKGNPGEAGAGIWIADGEGKKIFEMSRYLGHRTNNEAEYWALLLGLREAERLGGESVRIFTDSELVERQLNGLYRVKNPCLKVLHASVMKHLQQFSSYIVESVPREENREADRLANLAVEQGRLSKK